MGFKNLVFEFMNKNVLFSLFLLASCASIGPREGTVLETSKKITAEDKPIKKEKNKNLESILKEKVARAKKEGKKGLSLLEGELFLKGSDSAFRSNYRDSILYFKYLLELQPNDPYLKKRYGIELIKIGRLGQAKVQLEELYEKRGNYSNIGLILGGIYNSLGQRGKAESVYLSIINGESKRIIEACLFLSKSYQVRKELKKAKKILKKCTMKTKRKELFLYYEGKIALEEGDPKKAKKLFFESLKRNPDYYLSVIELGKLFEKEGKLIKALELYESFLKREPMAYPILTRTVNVLLRLNEKERAIPYVEALTRIDPTDLNLKLRLGLFYIDVKRYEDSKSIFNELFQEVPNSAKVLFYLGVLHKKTGKFDEAILYFSKIKKDNSYFKESLVQVANILMEKAVVKGKNDFNHFFVKKFTSFTADKSKEFPLLKLELMSLMSSFYESLGQYKKSIKVLESLKGESGFSESHEYYLASLYEKNKDFLKAREIITGILKKNPNNPHALNFLGYSMLEKNENLALALKYIKKAVQLRPKDGYIRDSLGWYYFKVGQISKAFKELKKAWELVKSDFIIAKHMAAIYLKKKKYKMAFKFYQEAIKASKNEEQKKEVLALIKTLQDRNPELSPKRLPASK
jgi:tetratricopeptide (TPR) repeat protein